MAAYAQTMIGPTPSTGISGSELVGASLALQRVRDAVRMVARTDAAVLIIGETGTGKELVARSVHDGSPRRHGNYVKFDCTSIPGPLLESELFGHERGAYTGALTQTTGRFQLADQGTLFLDEIGELPLELQPKLLRILQEKEFERLGSGRTIRVNVRVVAATNQNLAQMVAEGRFRADLFYRLNVFPIAVPALRERLDDIPLLAMHFVRMFGDRMKKGVNYIPDEVMQALQSFDWPGNIRELQHFIERAIIMSPGPALRLPPMEPRTAPAQFTSAVNRTLAQAERDHITEALQQVGWVVGGRKGAAYQLGLPRTTLLYKMRKLGIAPPQSAPGLA